MKFRNFCIGLLCLLSLNFVITSCDDDDEIRFNDEGSKIELPAKRAYILFEGSMGANNSGLTMFDPSGTTSIIPNIYELQNDKPLGETAQSLIEENNYLYLVEANSAKKLNSAGVEVATCQFKKDEFGNARYCVEDNGYLYVSHYGGKVSKVNAQTMKLESSVATGGQQLESITECNNKIYVANAYTPQFEYLEEVIVINPQTMEKENTIKVTVNPTKLMEMNDKVYLISTGNYKDVTNKFQVIDPKQNNKVTIITDATKMAEGNRDIIYLINTKNDENYTPTNTFFTYNTKTGDLNPTSFIKDAVDELKSANIYMLKIDEETNDIYIATTDYVSNGKIYRFDKNGKLIEKFTAGGINPNSMVFLD